MQNLRCSTLEVGRSKFSQPQALRHHPPLPMTAQTFLTGNGDSRQTLVAVFLRGGADGLSLVAPLEDDAYHKARPRIGIKKSDAIALDGFYGLHPQLRDLEQAWK